MWAKMTEPFLGEMRNFGFNFAPRGWAQCAGQLLQISQNTALFSLLGTMYGGDGRITFALPDLRGRMSVTTGQGPGLSNRSQGEVGGRESVTLTSAQIPSHTHTTHASASASSKSPDGTLPAFTNSGSSYGTTSDLTMSPAMTSGGGSGQPHDNMPPYLVTNWCIALEGVFPTRQ